MSDVEQLLTGNLSRTTWDICRNYTFSDRAGFNKYVIAPLLRLDETEGAPEEFVSAILLSSLKPEYQKAALSDLNRRLGAEQPEDVLQVVDYCDQVKPFKDASEKGDLSRQDYVFQLYFIAVHSVYFNEKIENGLGRDIQCLQTLYSANQLFDTMDRDVLDTGLYRETMMDMKEIVEVQQRYQAVEETAKELKKEFQAFREARQAEAELKERFRNFKKAGNVAKDGFRF